MDKVFVEDIWSQIIAYLEHELRVRLSLATKPAARQIWSLTTSIDARTHQKTNPYDSIFKFVGQNLKKVSLSEIHAYPTILRHLANFCPNLSKLEISWMLFEKFPSMETYLEKLLVRVETFGILPLPFIALIKPTTTRDKLSSRWCSFVNKIKEPIGVRNLKLWFAPSTLDANPTGTLLALDKFPSLVRLSAPIIVTTDLSCCPLLESITNAKPIDGPGLRSARVEVSHFIHCLRNTKVGVNVTFSDGITILQFLFRHGKFRDAQQLLKFLSDAGLQRALSMDQTLQMLTGQACKQCESSFPSFMQDFKSGKSRLLPSFDAFLKEVDLELFYERVIGWHSWTASYMNLVSKDFGPPPSAITPFFMLSSVLTSEPFQLEKIEFLFDSKLVDDSALTAAEEDDNLFFFVHSLEAANWLLDSIGTEASSILLQQRSPIAHLILMSRPKIALAIANRFPDLNLLSFSQTPADFDAVVEHCIEKNDLKMLQVVIEATGFVNVSAASRARAVMNACIHSNTAQVTILQYLVDLINGGDVKPDFFACGPKDRSHALISTAMLKIDTAPEYFKCLSTLIRRHEAAFVEQYRKVERDSFFFWGLLGAVIRIQKKGKERSWSPVDTTLQQNCLWMSKSLLPQLAAIRASFGQSSVVHIIELFHSPDPVQKDIQSEVMSLLDKFIEIDFAQNTAPHHQTYLDADEVNLELSFFPHVFDKLVRLLHAPQLNEPTGFEYGKTILEYIFLMNPERVDDFHDTIRHIVGAGGRLSETARKTLSSSKYPESLELYYDELRIQEERNIQPMLVTQS